MDRPVPEKPNRLKSAFFVFAFYSFFRNNFLGFGSFTRSSGARLQL